MIPYSRQFINSSDILEVKKVLKSNYLTTGPTIEKFENYLKKKFKAKYCLVVNSATNALHLSCLSLNFKKNDILWTSPITFVSSVNCGLYCKGRFDLIDIDITTFNISLDKLEKKIKKTKKKPKLIIPVHLGGNPIDLKRLKKLSNIYKFKILEDASHAGGSKINENPIGSCKYSDISVFSFHPVKPFTTGEGGAIFTNNRKIYQKIKILRNQGIDKKHKSIKSNFIKPWHYDVVDLGYNYRMTDIQAALGISQLSRIEKFTKKRNKIATFYKKKLSKKVLFQKIRKDNLSSYHLFIILVSKKERNKIVSKLFQSGYSTNLHYIPIYRHKYLKKYNFKYSNFPNSEKYYKQAISIPIFYNLSHKHQKKIVDIINSVIE